MVKKSLALYAFLIQFVSCRNARSDRAFCFECAVRLDSPLRNVLVDNVVRVYVCGSTTWHKGFESLYGIRIGWIRFIRFAELILVWLSDLQQF